MFIVLLPIVRGQVAATTRGQTVANRKETTQSGGVQIRSRPGTIKVQVD